MSNNLNEKALNLISDVKRKYPKNKYPGVTFEHLPPLEEAVRLKTVTKPMIENLNKELNEVIQNDRKATAEQARALVAEIKADTRYAEGNFPNLDKSINAAEKRLAIIFALNGKNITAQQAVTNLEIIKEQWGKITGNTTQIEVDITVLEEEAYPQYGEIQRYGPPPKGQFPAFDELYAVFSKGFKGLKFDSATGKYVSGKFTKATQEALNLLQPMRETWATVLATYKESFLKNFVMLKDKWRETIESDEECKQWVSKLEELHTLVGGGDQEALASACDLMTRLQERHTTKAQPQRETKWKEKLQEIRVLERALEKKIGVKKYDSIYKFRYGGPIEDAYEKYVAKNNPIYEDQFFKKLDAAKTFLELRLSKSESSPKEASPASDDEKAKYEMEDDNDDDNEEDDDEEEEDEDEEDDYESSFIDDDDERPHVRFHKKNKNGEKRPRDTNNLDWEELAQVASVATENTWKRFKEEEDKSLESLKKLVKDQGKRYKIFFTNKSEEVICSQDMESPTRERIAIWASQILQQYRQSTQEETNEITFRIVEEEEENKQNI
jgi:hypothetical protein